MEKGADQVDLQLAEQAAQWVQRLKRLERVTPQDRDEFMAWVKESAAHVRELLLAVNVDDMLARHRSGATERYPSRLRARTLFDVSVNKPGDCVRAGSASAGEPPHAPVPRIGKLPSK